MKTPSLRARRPAVRWMPGRCGFCLAAKTHRPLLDPYRFSNFQQTIGELPTFRRGDFFHRLFVGFQFLTPPHRLLCPRSRQVPAVLLSPPAAFVFTAWSGHWSDRHYFLASNSATSVLKSTRSRSASRSLSCFNWSAFL